MNIRMLKSIMRGIAVCLGLFIFFGLLTHGVSAQWVNQDSLNANAEAYGYETNQGVQSGCFPAGTNISLSDGTTMPIEQISSGQKVISRTESGVDSVSAVEKLIKIQGSGMCKISFDNSDSLLITANHPIATVNGWSSIDPRSTKVEMPAFNVRGLRVGDGVVKYDGEIARVSDFSCYSQSMPVYNLSLLGEEHNYFAEGYLVHNKDITSGGTTYWSWTCFPAGTKVTLTDNEKINIEDIKVGDKVLSQSEVGTRSISTVTEIERPLREHMCRINFEDGEELKLTNEHPLLSQDGWKSISPDKTAEENPNLITKSLTVGDRIVREDGETAIVKDFNCWSQPTQAYNLILDGGAHTYFADGYLAHNKGGGGGEVCAGACPSGYNKVCNPNAPQTDRQIKRSCNCRTSTGTMWGQYYYYDWGIHERCNDREGCWEEYTWGDYTDCYACSCVPICSPVAPGAATLQSPENNYRSTTTSVTLSWGAPASWGSSCVGGSKYYVVWVRDNVNTTWRWSTVQGEGWTYDGVTTATFTGGIRGRTYEWGVSTYYDGGGAAGTSGSGWSGTRFFTITEGVIGTVYLDPNNTCSTASPWNGGALKVSLRDTIYNSTLASNGTFVLGTEATPGTYNLDLTNIPEGYVCSTACGVGCPSKTGVINPSSGNNFFITTKREAWWQAFGSSLYAGGNVRSEIPDAANNLIEPGVGGAIGALLRASGSVDTGSGEVSEPGYSTLTKYRGKAMNYDFFAAQMGVTRSTVNSWFTNLLTKPSNDPGKDFYYIDPTSGEAMVSEPWTVVSGESYVVLVDGNLRIASDIVVEPGGFLAFIVNGDIIVSPAVTKVQGLFVANSSLITESNGTADLQLGFQGSMVAWGGVALGRDLNASNIDDPAETFTYRPDLLTSMPEKMKVFALRWKEVAPGTF